MLGSKAKRELQKNQRRICIDSIEIGISSPQQICAWGQRRLPNGKKVGEIKNSKTVNYKRFTPLRDGLFCERIFGPVKSFVCACGKRQPRADITFCEKCEVEYIDQRARRYRLGHISLVSPVAHMWYVKGRPSYISLFLGKRKNRIIQLAYANAYLVEHNFCSYSKLHFASSPSNVIQPTFEREKHGASTYIQNVNGYLATRQVGYMLDNLKKQKLHTFHFPSNSNAKNTNFYNYNGKFTTKGKADKSLTNFVFESPQQDRREEQFIKDTNVREASFQLFERDIKKKNSPISFFYLLTEVLGSMNKNIVCIDRNIIDKTSRNQLPPLPDKKDSFFKTNKKTSFDRTKEDHLSLRALWGYLVCKQDAQDMLFPHSHSLLNTSQSGFSSLKQRSRFQAIPNSLENRLVNRAKSRDSEKSQNLCQRNIALSKSHRLAFSPSSKLSQYLHDAKEQAPFVLKMCFYWSKVSTNCSFHLSPSVPIFPYKSWIRPALHLIFKKLVFSCLHDPKSKEFLLLSSRRKHRKETSIQKIMTSLYSAKQNKMDGTKDKSIQTFMTGKMGNHTKIPSFESLTNLHAVNWDKQTSDWYFEATSQKLVKKEYPFRTNTEKTFSSSLPQLLRIDDNLNNEEQKIVSNQLKRTRLIESSSRYPQFTIQNNASLLTIAQTPQRTLNLYNRVYAMPFLPSLVCKFQLRDELLNFVESSPYIEDKPIWAYCQLERPRPLRDVHKFMSEQMLSQSPDKVKSVELKKTDFNTNNANGLTQVNTKFLESFDQDTLDSRATLSKIFDTTKHLNDTSHDVLYKLDGTASNFNNFDLQQDVNKKLFDEIHPKRANFFDVRKFNLNETRHKNTRKKRFLDAKQNRKIHTTILAQNSQLNSGVKFLDFSKKKNPQHRILEHLESLRYILYQALLDKSLALQMESLHTNILASAKKIPVATPYLKSLIIPSNLFDKIYYKRLLSSGIKAYLLSLDNRLQKNSYAHVQTRSKLFKEVPSLIGLASRFKMQSPEKSYRALLLEKAWLRSLIIEKNISHQESWPLKTRASASRFAFGEYLPKDTILSQGGLGLYSHSRFVFSLAQAFGQFVRNTNQFDTSFFHKYCTFLWETQKTGWDVTQFFLNKDNLYNKRFLQESACYMSSKNVQRFSQEHEKRILHMVYTDTFVKGENCTNSPFYKDLQYRPFLAIDFQSPSFAHKDDKYSYLPLPPLQLERQTISSRTLSFFLILPHLQSLQKNPIDYTGAKVQKSDQLLHAKLSFQGQVKASSHSQFSHVSQTVNPLHHSFDTSFPVSFHSFSINGSAEPKALLSEFHQGVVKESQNSISNGLHQSFVAREDKASSPTLLPKKGRHLFGRGEKSYVVPSFVQNAVSDTKVRKEAKEEFHTFSRGQKDGFSGQNNALASLDGKTIREILSYTGGGALQKLLQGFDTQLLKVFLLQDIQTAQTLYKKRISESDYPLSRVQKRVLTRLGRRIFKNSRRLKLVQLLMRCKRRPEWMMISILPVLPPDLRPILQMSEGVVVASDLNNLYQRVVYRNNRFHKLSFIDFHLVTAIQRLVQDAVDRLIENGKGGSKPFYTPAGRPLKSLSDTLKGKKGRFRLNLLGKRVDFSGRSVIVVSPHLHIHECGLPREIAIELYDYFLLRHFMLTKQASSIVMAKKIIKQKTAIVWDALRNIMYHHPVLLNRAPTLHRLGIQAFQPKLVLGNAIFLHPLVCSGFNADFDGDQMGVHLPLSTQARAEAWDLLWARNNLLSPATGQPVLVPSQDMVLGFYYMTQSFFSLEQNKKDVLTSFQQDQLKEKYTRLQTQNRGHNTVDSQNTFIQRTEAEKREEPHVFVDCMSLLQAFQNKYIYLHTPVWLQWKGFTENNEKSQSPLEIRLDAFGGSTYIYAKYKRRKDENVVQSQLYIRTTAGRVLLYSKLF